LELRIHSDMKYYINKIYSSTVELKEFNPYTKKWRKELEKIALVYPNKYKAGISNVGLQQMYAEVNAHEKYICERFYSDVFEGKKSVESGTSISSFSKALFSIQYEDDYSKSVELSKFVDFRIAGGPCVMENPLPLKKFFNSFFVGEADGIIDKILNEEDVEGLYSGNGSVKRRWIELKDHLRIQIVGEGAYGRAVLLEVGRGCKRRCRFCIVRQIYNPCRWRELDLLVEVAEECRKFSDKIALIAPSPTDHPKIKELISVLVDMGYTVSPSSIRADTVDDELIELLIGGGLKSITIAPEAGSERMREILNKGVNEEDVLHSAKIASNAGIQKVKLYFMIGLPGETERDLKEIVNLVEKIKKLIPRVSASINPLVPKPHTPFQWLPFGGVESKVPEENIRILKDKMKFLKNKLSELRVDVDVGNVEKFAIQTILSRGDEEVGEAIPPRKINIRRFAEYLEKIDVDERLPWDFIDHGYRKRKLVAELEKTFESIDIKK